MLADETKSLWQKNTEEKIPISVSRCRVNNTGNSMADHGEKLTLAPASDSLLGSEQTQNWRCVSMGMSFFVALCIC